ncbi:MAG: hypothetical protein NVSMB32_05030 [Actinomycetota bacterium]
MIDEVAEFLAGLPPEVGLIAESLRRLIRAELAGTLEMLDTPTRLFGYGRDRTYRGLICTVAPHGHHVSLIFSKGVDLSDPLGLLEGTGKAARHVQFRGLEDIHRAGVSELIQAAGRLTPAEN